MGMSEQGKPMDLSPIGLGAIVCGVLAEVRSIRENLESISLRIADLTDVLKNVNNSLVAVAMGKEKGSDANYDAV